MMVRLNYILVKDSRNILKYIIGNAVSSYNGVTCSHYTMNTMLLLLISF